MNILWIVFIVMSFIILGAGAIGGHYDYNYELDKCSELKTSNYDFDMKLEINADYSQDCFYYNSHPMAYAFNILSGVGLALMIWLVLAFVGVAIYTMYDL